MSDPNNPPDAEIDVLHQEALDALARIGALLDSAYAVGVTYGAGNEWERNRRELRGQAESMRGLELIMPIVAPMKAGKSTLINAIVGHPLLPTRIKLVDGLDPDRPQLFVPRRTIGLFERIGERIRERVKLSGWTVPQAQSHLRGLARDIADGSAEPVREEYVGRELVQSVLTRLNDQLRLAVLAEAGDLLSDLRDLRELWTGHWGGYPGAGAGGGELVLVDTPGPNEYALSSQLGAVLDDILRASHVVLVVVDYTQMGADAAQTIGDLLRSQVDVIGTEKVLAVVNKVDARHGQADLSAHDTRTAVAVGLGLTGEQAAGRIFETQARRGLEGVRMLAELDRYGDEFVPSDSEAARSLMHEAQPLEDWEEIRHEITASQLRRLAQQMMKRGGVTELVGTAMARLRADAAPVLIDSGARRHLEALVRLGRVLRLERKAADLDRAAVADQLATLDGELRELRDLHDAMPDTAVIEQRFSDELADFMARLRDQGDSITALLTEARDQDPPDNGPAAGGEFFPSLLRKSRKLLWTGVLGGTVTTDVQEFASEVAAKDFAERMGGSVAGQLTELLDYARRELDHRTGAVAATAVGEQETAVRELIARSTANLSTVFSVALDVPPPVVVDGAIAVELPKPTVRHSSYTSTYTTVERQPVKWTGGLFSRNVTVEHNSTSYSQHFQVSRTKVADELRQGFHTRLAEIQGDLNRYVTETVHEQLTAYYGHLDDFLQGFRDAIARALDNSRLSEADQARRKSELEQLADRTTQERAGLVALLDRLDDYRDRQAGRPA